MQELLTYSTNPVRRKLLAAILADACALLGWQWLDQADTVKAWNSYTQGAVAASESGSAGLRSYVLAGQAVVLLDIGDTAAAVQLTEYALTSAQGRVPALLHAWLLAAHGEACAAHGDAARSLHFFDAAARALSSAPLGDPHYLVFGDVHLVRWRGSALAKLRDTEAAGTLTAALDRLDPTFTRAETALRTDLAYVLRASDDPEAATPHADKARQLAERIGSIRHTNRLRLITS